MKQTIAMMAAAFASLLFAGSVLAHHSGSMYQTTPIWIKGTVVGFEHVNPHTTITLEDRSGGQVRQWAVEGPGQSQLERMGIGMDFPRIGAVVEFCAFPYKSTEELSRLFPGVDFANRRTAPQFVAGHVMVLQNGEKEFWEPHGVLSECIRSSTIQRQSWLDFINANARARQGWCEQRQYAIVQSSPTLRDLVAEINRLIAYPCQ